MIDSDFMAGGAGPAAADPKKAAALDALRAAVKAKVAYWDAMGVLENAFGFNTDDNEIPDATSDNFVEQVEMIASGAGTDDELLWIGEDYLTEFMSSCGVTL